ncbi:hypothetical protein NLG97_g11256 [Lecanicillium saksenae]|uniref:Uncharacterized protein n=1 Tax=Lecanicillium saksenae TaxID=468837 RepID=A0ACC1QAY1_9HYPO|nr:hypothetical protein NLG97_g11256 [Lecanicillium saksenae]
MWLRLSGALGRCANQKLALRVELGYLHFASFTRQKLCTIAEITCGAPMPGHFDLVARQRFVQAIPASQNDDKIPPQCRNSFLQTGDYCDVYLTHDSMSVRKAHNSGRNHLRNVVDYYQRSFCLLASGSRGFARQDYIG